MNINEIIRISTDDIGIIIEKHEISIVFGLGSR
jgi:hypothetical protein